MSLNLVIVRRSNADGLTTVIVGREARAFVAPETELPPVPASKKRAHQSPIIHHLAPAYPVASSPNRCGYMTARRPSLCR